MLHKKTKTLPEISSVPLRKQGQGKRALLRDLLLGESRFELLPLKGAADQADHLPVGGRVTVTCSPKKGIESTLRLCEVLREKELEVVPHISARLVRDVGHLDEILEHLARLEVRDIFVPGGDVAEPAGQFRSSLELLAQIADRDHELEQIGVAAYPEGHSLIDEETLFDALNQKQALSTYMVTQMCFSPGSIFSWLRRMRERGVQLPVYVGIPGVASRARLLQISLKIGVGQSLRFLNSNRATLRRLFKRDGYTPEKLLKGLSQHFDSGVDGVQGFHIYTFNQVEKTERWRQEFVGELSRRL